MSSQLSTLTPVLKYAHQLVKERLSLGDYAIDATLGNGHDTLMLAQQVGQLGKVWAFDVQDRAFEKSQILLEKHGVADCVQFIKASHEHMSKHVDHAPKVIMFNLGYLPGADKCYTTQVHSTLLALEDAIRLLPAQGLLLVVVYVGHPEGKEEDKAVSQWATELDQRQFQVLRYGFINQINHPPYLLAIEKLHES